MVNAFPSNAGRPSPGSVLANWMQRHQGHPDSFVCGVRVVTGEVPGERTKWRYARRAVDALQTDGVYTLNRGDGSSLRLRVQRGSAPADGPKPRAGLAVLAAIEVGTGAHVLLALPPGELIRFGIEGL